MGTYFSRKISFSDFFLSEKIREYINFLKENNFNSDHIRIKEENERISILLPQEINFQKFINIKFWEYQNKYLISEVNLNLFVSNPEETSIALNNCLNYCDNKIIENLLETAKESSERASLIAELNDKINKFLKSNWKDFHDKKEIEFEINDKTLSFNIKTKKKYDHLSISKQSDGYKQFLSILFSIGLDKHLNNTLILIDEPEIHLHPSSVLQLKEMLKTLLKNENILVLSTHSVNMIDRNNLDECILVEDDEGQTKIKQEIISSDSLPNIIKQSFGINIFSNFMFRKNVIFVEGQSDKIILEKLLNSAGIDFWIFICHGDNAPFLIKNVKDMYPTEYWDKNCFAIFDEDEAGLKIKSKVNEILKKYNVFTLGNFVDLNSSSCKSIEVFYDDEMYNNFCSESANLNNNNLQNLKLKFANDFVEKYKDNKFDEKITTFRDKIVSSLIK